MAEPAQGGTLSYRLGEAPARRAPIDPAFTDTEVQPLSLSHSLEGATFAPPPPVAASLPRALPSRPPVPSWRPFAEGTLSALLGLLLLRSAWQWRRMWRGLRRRHHAGAITTADWPALSVVLPPGHPPAVLARCIQALLRTGYPAERLHFLPLFTSAAPLTRGVLAPLVGLAPERIVPVAVGGRLHDNLDALRCAFVHAPSDLMVVVDVERKLPPEGLKQAVAPFLDPAVGAIQGTRHGRAPATTLSRLLDLARQAQTAQRDACSHTGLLPGATVLGVRRSAWLSCASPQPRTPFAEVEFVAHLAQQGWRIAMQSALSDLRPSPLRWADHLRRVRAASVFPPAAPRLPGALQALPTLWISLAWLAGLALSLALYFAGSPLFAGGGLLLLALNAFDASGRATHLLNTLVAASARRQSDHLLLLPLMPLLHLLAAVQPLLARLARVLPQRNRTRLQLLATTQEQTT